MITLSYQRVITKSYQEVNNAYWLFFICLYNVYIYLIYKQKKMKYVNAPELEIILDNEEIQNLLEKKQGAEFIQREEISKVTKEKIIFAMKMKKNREEKNSIKKIECEFKLKLRNVFWIDRKKIEQLLRLEKTYKEDDRDTKFLIANGIAILTHILIVSIYIQYIM